MPLEEEEIDGTDGKVGIVKLPTFRVSGILLKDAAAGEPDNAGGTSIL